jgi:hypothetical protein
MLKTKYFMNPDKKKIEIRKFIYDISNKVKEFNNTIADLNRLFGEREVGSFLAEVLIFTVY